MRGRVRESDPVKPTSCEAVDEKVKEALKGVEKCEELLEEVKRLLGVVEKEGRG